MSWRARRPHLSKGGARAWEPAGWRGLNWFVCPYFGGISCAAGGAGHRHAPFGSHLRARTITANQPQLTHLCDTRALSMTRTSQSGGARRKPHHRSAHPGARLHQQGSSTNAKARSENTSRRAGTALQTFSTRPSCATLITSIANCIPKVWIPEGHDDELLAVGERRAS